MLPVCDVIPSRTRPWATLVLIASHAVALAAAWSLPHGVVADMLIAHGFVPARAGLGPAATALWLHENTLHAALNMLALWLFGASVEDRLGRTRYLLLYAAAATAGLLAELWAAPSSPIPIVGASGAVAGIVAAHAMLFPGSRVLVLVPIDAIEVPSSAFMLSWLVLQVFGGLGRVGPVTETGLGLWTPLGGAMIGLLLARLLARRERMAPEWWPTTR